MSMLKEFREFALKGAVDRSHLLYRFPKLTCSGIFRYRRRTYAAARYGLETRMAVTLRDWCAGRKLRLPFICCPMQMHRLNRK